MLRPRETMLVFLVVGLLGTAPLVHAQEAEQTARQSKQAEREAMYYRYLEFASYVKGGSIQPHWMADGSSFWYAEGAPANTVIWKVDPRANTKTPLFDTARLGQALTKVLGHEPPYKGLPFDKFSFVDGEKAIKFTMKGKDFVLQLDTYTVTQAPALSEEEKSRSVARTGEVLSPDRRWFASVKDYNLWLRSTYDGRSVQITTDGIEDYAWNMEGAQWSRDSSKLAVKKMDYRQVPKIPIVHWLKRTEEVEWLPYAKAGQPMPQTDLFLVDILSKRQVRVDTGEEPDQHIYVIGWRRDGSELIFLRLDRYFKKLDLMAANQNNGHTRIILTEAQKTWIPVWQQWDRFFRPCADGKRFIWLSERDGWRHIYLYNLDGTLVTRLTEGAFPVVQVVAVDDKTEGVYFTAQAEVHRPYDIHLYRVSFDGRDFTRLTEATGQHTIQFAPSTEFFLDTHSTTERPPAVELRRADGMLQQTLSGADIKALKDIEWHPPEEFVVKAADGKTDIYGILYKPHDFDLKKKYPLIEIILAGPYTGLVPHTFTRGVGVYAHALAQLGFVVFIVDGRGTPGRGRAFRDTVYGNVGRYEIPDHVTALRQVAKKRPYMDLSRIGVFGLSYGGYMTLRAMLMAPDVYHVGVARSPITDMAEHWWNERLMGQPQDNKAAYEHASNVRLAANLKGKLLLIHGTSDAAVPFSHTVKMVEALIQAGKSYDLIVLPEQGHGLSGSSRAYAREATRRYFQEHLQPQEFCKGDISSPRKLVEKSR